MGVLLFVLSLFFFQIWWHAGRLFLLSDDPLASAPLRRGRRRLPTGQTDPLQQARGLRHSGMANNTILIILPRYGKFHIAMYPRVRTLLFLLVSCCTVNEWPFEKKKTRNLSFSKMNEQTAVICLRYWPYLFLAPRRSICSSTAPWRLMWQIMGPQSLHRLSLRRHTPVKRQGTKSTGVWECQGKNLELVLPRAARIFDNHDEWLRA